MVSYDTSNCAIVLGGVKVKKSIEDLRKQYIHEFPQDQLVSIPVAKLQDYASVPYNLTEDDIRTNIDLEGKEILKERLQKIQYQNSSRPR